MARLTDRVLLRATHMQCIGGRGDEQLVREVAAAMVSDRATQPPSAWPRGAACRQALALCGLESRGCGSLPACRPPGPRIPRGSRQLGLRQAKFGEFGRPFCDVLSRFLAIGASRAPKQLVITYVCPHHSCSFRHVRGTAICRHFSASLLAPDLEVQPLRGLEGHEEAASRWVAGVEAGGPLALPR